jgi:phosphomannomutase
LKKHGITFGTDGWRGIIAESFTVDRVHIVAQAFADWLVSIGRARAKVLVGYDGRFGGEMFALALARVLAGNGFRPDVTSSPAPTPAVSWWILKRRYAAGLMVTASHNPPAYNGIKVKPYYGGSPDEAEIGPIVARLGRKPPKVGDLRSAGRVSFLDAYMEMLRRFVDLKALKRLAGTVVSDPMGGAQAGLLPRVLAGTRLRIVAIHDRIDPMFCGLASPEPVEKNLLELIAAVRRERGLAGIATDGDGDRVGIVADGGSFLSPHQVFALLVLFMVRVRGLTGSVVKTVSGSFLLDRIARAHRLKVLETPVGFKHICRLMRTEDILIGGEESGGIGVRGFIPERDGLLSGLLFLELLAKTGKSCRRLLADLEREFGVSRYARIDAHHEQAAASLGRLISAPPSRLAGERVAGTNTLDGLKLTMEDDSWVLLRASGTEPLLRIYAESGSTSRTRGLLAAGAALAGVKS